MGQALALACLAAAFLWPASARVAAQGSATNSGRQPVGTGSNVTILTASKLLADVRDRTEVRPGITFVDYIDDRAAVATIIRRTAVGKAELHRQVRDVWCVIEGAGKLVTGGVLTAPVEEQPNDVKWQSAAGGPNELRAQGISGGVERQVRKGDLVIIPASTPHWMSKIDGEMAYLVIKLPVADEAGLAGAPADSTREVLAADDSRRVAMLKADVAALDDLLVPDATISWGDGTVDDKASMLELFRSGRLRYRRFEFEDRRVRFYGETAVVSGKARVEAQSDGKPVEHLVNVTRVWVRQQSRWRLAAVQTTRVSTNP